MRLDSCTFRFLYMNQVFAYLALGGEMTVQVSVHRKCVNAVMSFVRKYQ